jgi:hypothetical protein
MLLPVQLLASQAFGSLHGAFGMRFQVKVHLQGVHANNAILFRCPEKYPFVIWHD